MDSFSRIVFCTVLLFQHTRSLENCSNSLGMSTRNKIIPDESITSSSYLRSDRAPSYARLDGPRAWCSAPGDNSPYIQILLEEEKLITAIETQGSRYDSIWSTRYDVWYLKRGNWTLHREGLPGNKNARRIQRNKLSSPIRTHSIRIYPKDPFAVYTAPKFPCLRLELYGCTAPASCPDPGIPYQGKRIDQDFRHGHTVRFTCPRDYVIEGAAAIKCTDGRWNSRKPSCKACPNMAILTGTSGSITSPFYPGNYRNNHNCSWKIMASTGYRVKLVIQDMDIESGTNCPYDYIQIQNAVIYGSGVRPGRLCGSLTRNSTFSSYHETLIVRFVTDGSATARGFKARYTTVLPVHGRYSSWGVWSRCSVTCGVGCKRRSRSCTNPAPAHGGRDCRGSSSQSTRCTFPSCRRPARDLSRANLTGLPFCENKPLPTRKPDGSLPCHPHQLLFDFQVRENHCTWWLVCRFSVEKKSVMCEDWAHQYNSMICYTPRCP